MLKRTCKQCGKEFILSESEIKFFKSRKLSLPKRCKECREANKQAKADVINTPAPEQKSSGKVSKINNSVKTVVLIIIAVLAVIAGLIKLGDVIYDEKIFDNPYESEQSYETSVTQLQFRNDELLEEHFEKHGAEVGASTEEEYLAKANAVISNPDALTKTESDDGDNDTVYYLESTREFVVVSEDGYIRTYYLADKDYFERQ